LNEWLEGRSTVTVFSVVFVVALLLAKYALGQDGYLASVFGLRKRRSIDLLCSHFDGIVHHASPSARYGCAPTFARASGYLLIASDADCEE